MFSVSCAVVVKKNPKPNTQKICQAKKSWSFYRVFFFFLPLNKEESEEFELFMMGN